MKYNPQSFSLKVLNQAQGLLLQCATPDSLARLHKTSLKMEIDRLWEIYFEQQHHGSFTDYLNGMLPSEDNGKEISAQVIYHNNYHMMY